MAGGGGGGGGAAANFGSYSGGSGGVGGGTSASVDSGVGGTGLHNTWSSSTQVRTNYDMMRMRQNYRSVTLGGGAGGGGGGGYKGGAGGTSYSAAISGGGGAGGSSFVIPGSTSITQTQGSSSGNGSATITYSGSPGNILIKNLKATGGLTFNTQGSYTDNSQTTSSPLSSSSQTVQRNIEKSTTSFAISSTNSPITKTTMTPSQMYNSFKPQAGSRSRFIKSTETNKTLPKDAKSNKTETNNQQNQKKDSSTDTKSNNIINQNEPNKTQSNNQPNQKQSSSSAVNDDEGL